MNPNTEKSVCEYNEFRRPRYFHGMLLDDKDFLDEQGYHAGKRRLLNRMLHGTGVVCGLDLNAERGGRWIEITAGLALDCCGNEIYVNKTRRFDLSQLVPPKKSAADRDDCRERDDNAPGARYYVGVRYDEKETNPVAVYLPGGGCEERTCESSRVKEGYCVELVDCCARPYPRGYPARLLKAFCDCQRNPETTEGKEARCDECAGLQGARKCMCVKLEEFCEQSVPCPECSHCEGGCHVILGRVDVDEKGAITNVCINDCREYVLTGGLIQHLIVSVLSGAEDIFRMTIGGREVEIPKVGELARNPILAFCWVVRHFLIERAEVTAEECEELFPRPEARKEEEPEMTDTATARGRSARPAAQQTALRDLQRRTKELETLVRELQERLPPPAPHA